MIKKGSNFFEEHIEKMVLILVALVCFWLLMTRVFLSPNTVEYNKKKIGTDKIDDYILADAQKLLVKLQDKPVLKPQYKPQSTNFKSLVDSAVDVNTKLYFPIPFPGREIVEAKLYNLPDIGIVSDVAVEHIRTVAYYPTEDVNEERNYYVVQHEPNDLDLVTVEGKFDVNGLFKRFYESFAGESIKQEWRNNLIAKPVFAAVQLQRQEMYSDGTWSQWQDVPRIKIDSQREQFKIPEKVEDLPTGGVKLKLFLFDKFQKELLQPMSYEIASANAKWYTPLLHKQLVEKVRTITEQKMRERRATEAALQEQKTRKAIEGRQAKASETKPSGPVTTTGGKYGETTPTIAEKIKAGKPEKKPEIAPEVLTVDVNKMADEIFTEVETEISSLFEKILIYPDTKLSDLNEPLVFWAHDDTVEPAKNYRYRIRLGVFNPVAGTDDISKTDESKRKEVILWSEFSQITDTVSIPGKSYFFPSGIIEVSKSVTIQVSKYKMGRWYSKGFVVQPGETIGYVVDVNLDAEKRDSNATPMNIDFSTGAIMVDAIAVNNWTISRYMTPKLYYNMIYSIDNMTLKKIACNGSFWPRELTDRYNEINKSQNEPIPLLKPWAPKSSGTISPAKPGGKDTGRFGTKADDGTRIGR